MSITAAGNTQIQLQTRPNMPFKSKKQMRFMNANKPKMEAQGVDVNEWNQASKGMKLPMRAGKRMMKKK